MKWCKRDWPPRRTCRARPASSTRLSPAAAPGARLAPAADRTPWAKAARARRRATTAARQSPDGKGQTHIDLRADGPLRTSDNAPRNPPKNFHGISFEFPKDSARRSEYGTRRSELTDDHIGSRLILMTWWREEQCSRALAPQRMGILVGISQPLERKGKVDDNLPFIFLCDCPRLALAARLSCSP